jgi:hypothetical protein
VVRRRAAAHTVVLSVRRRKQKYGKFKMLKQPTKWYAMRRLALPARALTTPRRGRQQRLPQAACQGGLP